MHAPSSLKSKESSSDTSASVRASESVEERSEFVYVFGGSFKRKMEGISGGGSIKIKHDKQASQPCHASAALTDGVRAR